jgi:hypothetical protein
MIISKVKLIDLFNGVDVCDICPEHISQFTLNIAYLQDKYTKLLECVEKKLKALIRLIERS